MKPELILGMLGALAAIVLLSVLTTRFAYSRGEAAGRLQSENAQLHAVADAQEAARKAAAQRDAEHRQELQRLEKELADAKTKHDDKLADLMARFPSTLPKPKPAEGGGTVVACALSPEYRELFALATTSARGD